MAKAILLDTDGMDADKTGTNIHLLPSQNSATAFRKKTGIKEIAEAPSDSNAKRANLFAAKKEKVKLPAYNDGVGGKKYHISEFLSHPSGIAALLNTRALQSFKSLDAHTYRCALPKLRFFNFEAAPLLDLRVTSTDEDCMVEMLSCKNDASFGGQARATAT